MLPLSHRFYETLRAAHLLLCVEQGFLVAPCHALLVVAVCLHEVGERLRHLQLRHIARVERESDVSRVACVHDEVGRYLLQGASLRLSERRSRLGVEPSQLVLQASCGIVVGAESRLYLVQVFLRELVEVVLHHLPHKSLHLVVGSAVYLEHQTLLQRVRPYARRVERLEYGNHPVHLLRCHVDVVIYRELVADTLRVFPEQTVVVERSDDIFHHLPALRVKLRLPHLLLEFVVERCGVAVHTFLILRPVALVAVVQCRHLVVAPDVLECCVERVVAVLPLLHGVEVSFGGVGVVVVVACLCHGCGSVLMRQSLKRGVVVNLRVYVLLKLRQRHFEKSHLQHLLLREPLHLLQFLFL